MVKKVPLPIGLKQKSPYAVLDNFDVGPLCLQLSALLKAIFAINIKNEQRSTDPSAIHT
jgi:hypothetical protein